MGIQLVQPYPILLLWVQHPLYQGAKRYRVPLIQHNKPLLNHVLIKPYKRFLIARHRRQPSGQLQHHHPKPKHIITFNNRWTLPHKPIPDPLHLLWTNKPLLPLQYPFIGSNSILQESFIHQLPQSPLPTNITQGYITMMIVMLSQIDQCISYAEQQSTYIGFGEGVGVDRNILQQILEALIKDEQLPALLTGKRVVLPQQELVASHGTDVLVGEQAPTPTDNISDVLLFGG